MSGQSGRCSQPLDAADQALPKTFAHAAILRRRCAFGKRSRTQPREPLDSGRQASLAGVVKQSAQQIGLAASTGKRLRDCRQVAPCPDWIGMSGFFNAVDCGQRHRRLAAVVTDGKQSTDRLVSVDFQITGCLVNLPQNAGGFPDGLPARCRVGIEEELRQWYRFRERLRKQERLGLPGPGVFWPAANNRGKTTP